MENAVKKLCPHCKQEVDPKASRCPHCHGKIPQWSTAKILLAILFGVFVISMINTVVSSSSSSNTTQAVSQEQIADLAAWQQTPAGKLCAKHTEWDRKVCDHVVQKDIWIGMPLNVLTYYYGAPDSDNVSNYGRGDRHQYCWDRYTPSCYYDNNSDGVIDSYN